MPNKCPVHFQTFAVISIAMLQDVLPLLQDLLQRCLQFTGQDAVFVTQLSCDRKSQHTVNHTMSLRNIQQLQDSIYIVVSIYHNLL